MNQFKIYYTYHKWLDTYEYDNDYPTHYTNAQQAVKEDIQRGEIKRNSPLHQALRELFIEKKPKEGRTVG